MEQSFFFRQLEAGKWIDETCFYFSDDPTAEEHYLGYLPVCAVKLDKSTIDAYLDGKPEFIENIVRLVHSLGMKLTVEGVEEKWQYDKLKSFGCDFIQGYFFSKPLSYEDLKTFVPKTE